MWLLCFARPPLPAVTPPPPPRAEPQAPGLQGSVGANFHQAARAGAPSGLLTAVPLALDLLASTQRALTPSQAAPSPPGTPSLRGPFLGAPVTPHPSWFVLLLVPSLGSPGTGTWQPCCAGGSSGLGLRPTGPQVSQRGRPLSAPGILFSSQLPSPTTHTPRRQPCPALQTPLPSQLALS